MDEKVKSNFVSELRQIIWPIEWHENKKFLPLAGIMFCILFNYSVFRSIKDGLIVTLIGAEALSFVKTYIVLPSAIIAMLAYVKLCNIVSQQKIFYIITSFFLIFFVIFAFILYPNPDLIHPNPEVIARLAEQYPNFKWFIRIAGKWFIRIAGKWSFASFYAFSELWGAMMVALLFWQFANQITKTNEAKRFYAMFGLIGNFGLLLTWLVLAVFKLPVVTTLIMTIISGIIIMLLYWWINENVLTDLRLYDPSQMKAKKNKVRLTLPESFKMIFTSKYLGLIALLILCYGASMVLLKEYGKIK